MKCDESNGGPTWFFVHRGYVSFSRAVFAHRECVFLYPVIELTMPPHPGSIYSMSEYVPSPMRALLSMSEHSMSVKQGHGEREFYSYCSCASSNYHRN